MRIHDDLARVRSGGEREVAFSLEHKAMKEVDGKDGKGARGTNSRDSD